ncbi:MAG: tetratricopeptide repeat protein, partial [Pseudomonadota bacterium]
SSFSLGRQTLDIGTIRDVLNVAYVLEGSVRRDGDRLKVTAQLIDTSDSSHVWSQVFERSPDELASVRQTIAERISAAILPGSAPVTVAEPARTLSPNESLLLARYYEQEVREQPEVDEDLLAEAIRLYRDAIEAQPDSALAHSRLAGALLYGGDVDAAEAPIFRALTLDPGLSAVQETLGRFFWLRGLPGAGAAWRRAVELNPNNADALQSYGYWYWMQGNKEGPEDYFRRAQQLDPLSLSRYAALGNYYAHEARIDETLAVIDRIERKFDNAAAFRLIARLQELTGRIDESIAWTIRARDLEPDNPDHTAALAELYADIGDIDTAIRLEPEPGTGLLLKMRRYREAIDAGEMMMIEHPEDLYLRYLLAFAYNVSGRSGDAVRLLETTGLPDTVIPEARQAIDVEAFVTLVDALAAIGATERSHELGEWWVDRQHSENPNWWIQLYVACPLAVIGRHDEALDRLERIADSPRLPWSFLVRDSHCFRQYAREPRYLAIVDTIEARRAALRARVPATLG